MGLDVGGKELGPRHGLHKYLGCDRDPSLWTGADQFAWHPTPPLPGNRAPPEVQVSPRGPGPCSVGLLPRGPGVEVAAEQRRWLFGDVGVPASRVHPVKTLPARRVTNKETCSLPRWHRGGWSCGQVLVLSPRLGTRTQLGQPGQEGGEPTPGFMEGFACPSAIALSPSELWCQRADRPRIAPVPTSRLALNPCPGSPHSGAVHESRALSKRWVTVRPPALLRLLPGFQLPLHSAALRLLI